MEARLLKIKEVSRYLGISIQTLYQWTSQHRIPFIKIGQGRIRFDITGGKIFPPSIKRTVSSNISLTNGFENSRIHSSVLDFICVEFIIRENIPSPGTMSPKYALSWSVSIEEGNS